MQPTDQTVLIVVADDESSYVHRTLRLAGVYDVLPIYDSLDEALLVSEGTAPAA